jgi:hypothetical protein
LLDRFVSDEVQDVPLRRGDRSRKEPPRITTRVLLKSATSGKPLASPRPPVTAKSLAINKTLLVGRKLKRFFPTLGNYVAKRKSVNLGVEFTYQQKWSLEVRYVDFFGGDRYNLLADRDYVSTTLRYSF